MKETTNRLRGTLVDMRKHWDWSVNNDIWVLEDAKTHEPLLVGERKQIMDEYDRRNQGCIRS